MKQSVWPEAELELELEVVVVVGVLVVVVVVGLEIVVSCPLHILETSIE
ncbi:MAG: hypothetical protein WBP81_34890 [Solirubrobacteraceae bacterium]